VGELLKRQRDTGELVWGQTEFPPHPHSSHGQAWFLEPLLFGMNWMKEEFAAEERARIDRALYRTADFILARPIPEMNNRGVIVPAVLAPHAGGLSLEHDGHVGIREARDQVFGQGLLQEIIAGLARAVLEVDDGYPQRRVEGTPGEERAGREHKAYQQEESTHGWNPVLTVNR
jgi:hypothetical protein